MDEGFSAQQTSSFPVEKPFVKDGRENNCF